MILHTLKSGVNGGGGWREGVEISAGLENILKLITGDALNKQEGNMWNSNIGITSMGEAGIVGRLVITLKIKIDMVLNILIPNILRKEIYRPYVEINFEFRASLWYLTSRKKFMVKFKPHRYISARLNSPDTSQWVWKTAKYS